MTTTTKCLVETKYAENTQTSQFTATSKTIIDKVSGYSAAGGALTINLVPSSGTAGAGNVQVSKTFAAGEAYTFPEIVGHTLEAGDIISTLAAASNTVTLRISGRVIT